MLEEPPPKPAKERVEGTENPELTHLLNFQTI